MTDPVTGGPPTASSGPTTVTRWCRRDLGGAWWAALVVVTVALGLVGRGSSGFWSVFLWSIVGFVLGSLVALFVAGRLVRARSEEEARRLSGGGTAVGS